MILGWPMLEFLAEQAWFALAALAAISAILIVASFPHRRLVAASPSIVAFIVFVLSCVAASLTTVATGRYFVWLPTIGVLLAASLCIPSVRALRNKWFGLLHLLALPVWSYLWFIASLAIGRDST